MHSHLQEEEMQLASSFSLEEKRKSMQKKKKNSKPPQKCPIAKLQWEYETLQRIDFSAIILS